MRRATMLAAAGVLGMTGALAGCASDTVDDAPGASAATQEAATAETVPSGTAQPASEDAMDEDPATSSSEPDPDNAFAFTATTLTGEEFDGLSIDDRDVILWFWAPWCPTCFAEAGEISAALPRLPEGIEVIGMAGMSDDLDYMKKFADDADVQEMTHVVDLDGDLWRRFDVVSQATVLVIDDSGDAYTLGGGVTADDLVDYAEKIAAT
ncbi:redoxin domain-containing protein [Demequina gelatinilytica]|uniref:redoxin domain-containing protein n=1 Tax=Demequina gelatinilytica TaxID=1638980 RepID=UPI0007827043|nr:redoxin domain-containing protein [Demequina gelatinilytica]